MISFLIHRQALKTTAFGSGKNLQLTLPLTVLNLRVKIQLTFTLGKSLQVSHTVSIFELAHRIVFEAKVLLIWLPEL